jgi:hypothetical protein
VLLNIGSRKIYAEELNSSAGRAQSPEGTAEKHNMMVVIAPVATTRRWWPEPPSRTFNIITTKRNKTAIAPTYIIKNMIAINSTLVDSVNSKPVALQNTSIEEITE